ncbi:hypothetical protein AB0L53_32360 [Nonomuraea sp. NPDC052129]|uniref:hypothetical protein n=1 Tax=Nonomuraea sp. NPDC052129 TaxID=3154651 RepID=UPI00343F8940
MIRLPVDVSDPAVRARVEKLFCAAWSLKRALQHDARARVEAYWAGSHRRAADARAWRSELGLTRAGLEHAAYAHLESSGHLTHHLSKALGMHLGDEVWAGVDRHLFADAAGKRAGRPQVGSWWGFTRIPGRARSHTRERKWETFRLAGTLAGHLAAYGCPAMTTRTSVQATVVAAAASAASLEGTASQLTVADALAMGAGSAVLAQPRRLPAPVGPSDSASSGRRVSWWEHTGPLSVVYTSAGAPDLVLPVRLPQGSGRWPYVAYFLDRPHLWHKIDLVRRRKASAPGGWTYEAHLLILDAGYACPATRARRTRAAQLERRAGVDGNVSNLAVVSAPAHLPTPPPDSPPSGRPDTATGADTSGEAGADGGMDGGTRVGGEQVAATLLTLTERETARLAREQRKAQGRARALERSRRASNPGRYHLSARQEARAERRADKGLPARQVNLPKGPRIANKAGVAKNAYRTDTLSGGYHQTRARHAQAARAFTEARQDRARRAAAQIIETHGANLVIEDCDIRAWTRLWGAAVARFTPGMLAAALAREATACGGAVLRAATTPTAMSQHCLCGSRVTKNLSVRVHHCDQCGLRAPRDLISAALASCVTLTDPSDPATARVDYSRAAQLIETYTIPGLQEVLSASTASCSPPASPAGTDHAAVTTPVASARRSAGEYGTPTPDETPDPGTTPDRRTRNPDYPDLRDSS